MLVLTSSQNKRYFVHDIRDNNGVYVMTLQPLNQQLPMVQMQFSKSTLPEFFDSRSGQVVTLDDGGNIIYLRPAPGTYVAKCLGFQKRDGIPLINHREAREAHGKNGSFTVPEHDEGYILFKIAHIDGQSFCGYEAVMSVPLPLVSYNEMLALRGYGLRKFMTALEALGVDIQAVNVEYKSGERKEVVLERLDRYFNTAKLYSVEVDKWGFVVSATPLPTVLEQQIAMKLLGFGQQDGQQSVQESHKSEERAQGLDPAFLAQFPDPVKKAIEGAIAGNEQDIVAIKAMALLDSRLNAVLELLR